MLPRLNKCYSPLYSDDFFNNYVSDRYYGSNYASSPAVNIVEGENEYRIDLAAAGLSKSDFEIHLDKDILTISSAKEGKDTSDEFKYTRREFNYTKFKRSFRLDESFDQDAIRAEHSNGVLSVYLPLKEQKVEAGPKSIEID